MVAGRLKVTANSEVLIRSRRRKRGLMLEEPARKADSKHASSNVLRNRRAISAQRPGLQTAAVGSRVLRPYQSAL